MLNPPRKNQLLFFSAFLLSAFGYEFIYFVMTVHIYDLTRSALNVGIFTALTFIPKLFSSVMGGIVDVYPQAILVRYGRNCG